MKTTDRDFNLYQEYCFKWQKFWGLYDWEFNFAHEKDEDNRAWACIQGDAKLATLGLSKTYDKKPSKEELSRVAFHEVCEVMLSTLSNLALGGYNHEVVVTEVHAIIRRLENRVFENLE